MEASASRSYPSQLERNSENDKVQHAMARQPFTIKMHPEAAFLCDLHAHLCQDEIIGFLAGYGRRVIILYSKYYFSVCGANV